MKRKRNFHEFMQDQTQTKQAAIFLAVTVGPVVFMALIFAWVF